MYSDNLFDVDTTGVQEMGGYEVFPAGFYPAVMITASKKPTKNNDGWYLECVYQIIDGEFNGKKFTSRLNLGNANVQTVDIAKRELKSLRLALGLPDTETRTQEFLHKPLVLNITVKPRKDKPDTPENNLIGIEPYNGAPAQARPAAPQAPQFQPAPQFQMGAVAPVQTVQAGYVAPQPNAGMPPHMQPTQAQPQQRAPAPAFAPNGQTPPWMQTTAR